MGSKFSSKMATASRVVQVVRPHAPLIKFPNRQSFPKPSVQDAVKMAPAVTTQMPSTRTSSASPSPGSPDTVSTVRDLPQRYRRRMLDHEEMDYIQRGGPE